MVRAVGVSTAEMIHPAIATDLWLFVSGSVYRDEFDLAILKLQEDNRLEILKRKWWDGGKCPKEEDHRAKGELPVTQLPVQTEYVTKSSSCCVFLSRPGHGEHWWDLRGACVWSAGGHLHGSAGVCLDAASYARNRGERGLFYLPLLSVLLPALAPPSLNPLTPHPAPHNQHTKGYTSNSSTRAFTVTTDSR